MNNPWVKHVKKVSKSNKIPFSVALVVASPSYWKGAPSKTHKGQQDFTTKKGDKVFHQGGHYVQKTRAPYTKKTFKKGAPSKTHKGQLDFTTKKGDLVFHQKGHFVRKPFQPFVL